MIGYFVAQAAVVQALVHMRQDRAANPGPPSEIERHVEMRMRGMRPLAKTVDDENVGPVEAFEHAGCNLTEVGRIND